MRNIGVAFPIVHWGILRRRLNGLTGMDLFTREKPSICRKRQRVMPVADSPCGGLWNRVPSNQPSPLLLRLVCGGCLLGTFSYSLPPVGKTFYVDYSGCDHCNLHGSANFAPSEIRTTQNSLWCHVNRRYRADPSASSVVCKLHFLPPVHERGKQHTCAQIVQF